MRRDVDLDLAPAPAPTPADIPWGYGKDRVTAMARDPYWIFVYWELTDEAIARARAEVASPEAPCILRVYETTCRLFDGTNANWYMDVPIHRPANNHYVRVNHPGSVFHVDIGVKSPEGYFAKIVRSAAVESPRDSISHDTRVEWMTVAPERPPLPEYRHRFVPRPGASPAPVAEGPSPAAPEAERIFRSLAGEGWARSEWSETDMGGRTVRWMRWSAPRDRVEIVFEGERRVTRTHHGERVVLGPWRITISALAPGGGRWLIDRWAVEYSWLTESGAMRVETPAIIERIFQGARVRVEPSGSEARLAAESSASESLRMGASEWRWLGGSEVRLGGASEVFYPGASEARYLGASEIVSLGASEIFFAGASGLGGASELFEGASERLAGGASEPPPPPPDRP